MNQTALFLFYGELNDFIPKAERNHWISYSFTGISAVKDAIEAIGIPHVEVSKILMNGMPVAFLQHLKHQTRFEVFPFEAVDLKTTVEKKFILDVHLGGLARALRLLGLDTLYQNNYTDKQLAEISLTENRIVLSRDVGLLKHKIIEQGYWLRSQITNEQIVEVIKRFSLLQNLKSFTRCIHCNGRIHAVEKDIIANQLLPMTKESFTEFFQCDSCKKVYWKGSHYERMQEFIHKIQTTLA